MSGYIPIEDLDFFKDWEALADEVYKEVSQWTTFAKNTVGAQWVESTDSVGANLVEGDARYSDRESLHFFNIARGSARESRYWLTRAQKRELVTEYRGAELLGRLESARRRLNALITSRRERQQSVREERASYTILGGEDESEGA